MPTFTITLPDGVAAQAEADAQAKGIAIEQHLAAALVGAATHGVPPAWMPREQWDALVRGDNCPLCSVIAAPAQDDTFGSFIADLTVARLRLAANQFVPGYCVLIAQTHVAEFYELPPDAMQAYFADLRHAARAIAQVFQPIKMNYEILGNSVPHLHCHIVPRYIGDPAPGHPINPELEECYLPPAEMAARVERIRTALASAKV